MYKLKNSKNSLLFVFTLFLFVVFFLSLSNNVLAKQFITIGTAGTGGMAYPCGVTLASYFTKHLSDEGYHFTAGATGGTGENLEMLRNKEIQMGTAGSFLARSAYLGLGPYQDKPKLENIRFFTALWPEAIQLVVLADSGIKELADFKGKKISVGPPQGGGTLYMPPLLDTLAGLTFDDMQTQYLNLADTVQAMQNRLIDGGYFGAGVPTSSVTELYASMSRVPVEMIEFTDEQFTIIEEELPFYAKMSIPKDTYPNQDKEILTPCIKLSLVVEKDVDADIVYKMLEVIYIKDLEEIRQSQSVLKCLDLTEAIPGLSGAPLHVGAVKFYQDHGIYVPDMLIPEEMK